VWPSRLASRGSSRTAPAAGSRPARSGLSAGESRPTCLLPCKLRPERKRILEAIRPLASPEPVGQSEDENYLISSLKTIQTPHPRRRGGQLLIGPAQSHESGRGFCTNYQRALRWPSAKQTNARSPFQPSSAVQLCSARLGLVQLERASEQQLSAGTPTGQVSAGSQWAANKCDVRRRMLMIMIRIRIRIPRLARWPPPLPPLGHPG